MVVVVADSLRLVHCRDQYELMPKYGTGQEPDAQRDVKWKAHYRHVVELKNFQWYDLHQ